MSAPVCSEWAGSRGRRSTADAGAGSAARASARRALPSLAAAAQRDQATDEKAHHRGPGGELGAVLADLALDVGDLDPAVSEGLHGARELLALLDDVAPDLLGRARTRRWRRPAPVAASLKGP